MATKSISFGKYDGLPAHEVADRDPEYLLWASEKMDVPHDAVARAVQNIERGQHWDYDDEQLIVQMVVPNDYDASEYGW